MRMAKVQGKFPAGRLVVTAGVNDQIADDLNFSEFVLRSLRRHLSGDWGTLDAQDKATNDQALQTGERLLSAYEEAPMPKIWIITEADRSVTTVLFPSEY